MALSKSTFSRVAIRWNGKTAKALVTRMCWMNLTPAFRSLIPRALHSSTQGPHDGPDALRRPVRCWPARKTMPSSRKEQRRPTKGFNMAILVVLLCVQTVGALLAISQRKWIIASTLIVLMGLCVIVLRGLLRSRTS